MKEKASLIKVLTFILIVGAVIYGKENEKILDLNKFVRKYQDQIVGKPRGEEQELSFRGYITRLDFKSGNFQGLTFECEHGKERYFPNGSIKWLSFKGKDQLVAKLAELSSEKKPGFKESKQSESTKTEPPRKFTIGISYDQVMNQLSKVVNITMDKVDPVTTGVYRGYDRFLGTTADGSIMLEIIGDKQNISEVHLIAQIRGDDEESTVRNTILLVNLFKNVTPEWPNGSDWLLRTMDGLLSSVRQGEVKSDTIIKENKEIEVTVNKY